MALPPFEQQENIETVVKSSKFRSLNERWVSWVSVKYQDIWDVISATNKYIYMVIHAEDSVVFTWRPFQLFLPLVRCSK